ncbi:lipase maturation factor [Nesidiocoris tenuis]|uniref:Lipase maturation factor n=1 Tax=Nesidiocoris tenuis TaxID=355587 RepID=A0ABN7A9Q4_9HEMI|nr:lipase maturation factor [Nesidiocoris tenuis]
MTELRFTRDLFLRCVCAVFLVAFTSFYIQIPGLYGKNGILPARTQLISKGSKNDIAAQIQKKPTLLWFGKNLGIETEHLMEILSLIGIFFAFTGFVSQKCCTKPIFSALWSLYYSLYQVGQTFMWYQWDVLLLEVGFLSFLLAPWIQRSPKGKKVQTTDPVDGINLWLVRWLLFRLLFSSGVVKLTSGCPTWWGLDALSVHFQSMVLPTPLAWYAHHLPTWFLKLNTVFANFAEILLPIFFFFPLRAVRLVAFWIQIFLQVNIILTGNYNFFNYLTIALCLSLVDDEFFLGSKSGKKSGWLKTILKLIVTLSVYGGLLYATIVLYGLKLAPDHTIAAKITFTPKEFDAALGRAMPTSCVIGFLSLAFAIYKSLKSNFSQTGTTQLWKVYSFLKVVFHILAALFIFSDSLVPFSTLHPAGNSTTTKEMRYAHERLSHLHLTNAYGLFRKMTGVGGRPEVIIEGSNSMEGPWLEYHFRYKPGHVNDSLPVVAPHQPRLDWQMWFAALGTYHQNPWIMSLTYRILTGQKDVLGLMDGARNPFPEKPPKFLRANLYHYSYTPWSQKDRVTTWTKRKVGEYFPVFSKDHPPLLDYLKNLNILGDEGKEPDSPAGLAKALNELRQVFTRIEPLYLMISLLMTGFAVIFFGSLPSSGPQPSRNQQPQQQHQQTQSKGKKKKF